MNRYGQFCYTYLLGWRNKDVWYYGARGQNKLPPEQDLLSKYPTSSRYVKEFIEDHGAPDVVRIHKLFDDYKSARTFESKFLSKLKADQSPRWLNRHTGPGDYVSSGPRLRSTIEKISKANTGKVRTPESRKKMSDAKKVYYCSDAGKETIIKISNSKKNCQPWNSGVPKSEESKRKASETIKAQFANGREPHNKGKPCSREQRKRLSEVRKGGEQTDEHKRKNSEKVKAWWAAGRPKGGLKNFD